jgi:ribonuclease J
MAGATREQTRVTFLHTGNPTGLKFLVEHGDARCLFDFGREHAPGRVPFSVGLEPRPGREIDDLLAVGAAPRVDGVYARDGWDGRTHVFLTHLHLDHTALVRYLHPDVPLCYPAAMEPVRRDAVACGYLPWREPVGTAFGDGAEVLVGPIRIRFVAVDHDTPGATGYLITTPELAIGFTGDHRRHGLHPELMERFAAAVRGCDLLIEECVGLSLLVPDPEAVIAPPPLLTEAEAIRFMTHAIANCSGLAVVNIYGMNRERIAGVADGCRASGRTLVMDPGSAGLSGCSAVLDPASVAAEPHRYCVQLNFESLPALIDLRPPPGSIYLHAGGAPIGPHDPAWNVMLAWMQTFGLDFLPVFCSGHSRPEDLERLVAEVAPKVVAPVHTKAPQLLQAPGVRKLLPEAGRVYSADELMSTG